MKRGMLLLVLLGVVAMLCVSYAAPTKITNTATATYTDADGNAYEATSNAVEVAVLDPPRVAAPASVVRGVPATITVTVDVGGPEWTYRVTLPTWGGTLVPGSLEITGGAGGIDGLSVWLDPLAEPGEVVCTYQCVW